jgi:hypothetical protein
MPVELAQAATTTKTLAMTSYTQEATLWCWAASAKMIIKYKKNLVTDQCGLVRAGLPSTACPNSSGTVDQTRRALTGNGLSSATVTGIIAMSTAMGQIDGNKPWIFGYLWRSGGGHMVAVHGYYYDAASADLQGLYWIDPITGSKVSAIYSYAKSNTSYYAGDSIYNIA